MTQARRDQGASAHDGSMSTHPPVYVVEHYGQETFLYVRAAFVGREALDAGILPLLGEHRQAQLLEHDRKDSSAHPSFIRALRHGDEDGVLVRLIVSRWEGDRPVSSREVGLTVGGEAHWYEVQRPSESA